MYTFIMCTLYVYVACVRCMCTLYVYVVYVRCMCTLYVYVVCVRVCIQREFLLCIIHFMYYCRNNSLVHTQNISYILLMTTIL